MIPKLVLSLFWFLAEESRIGHWMSVLWIRFLCGKMTITSSVAGSIATIAVFLTHVTRCGGKIMIYSLMFWAERWWSRSISTGCCMQEVALLSSLFSSQFFHLFAILQQLLFCRYSAPAKFKSKTHLGEAVEFTNQLYFVTKVGYVFLSASDKI